MKYPYIGCHKDSNLAVLFTSESYGAAIPHAHYDVVTAGDFKGGFNEREFKNITREYLTNTYGKVESKEYAEFIVKLAKANNIKVIDEFSCCSCFCFHTDFEGNLLLCFYGEETAKDGGEKLITIPLPPKETESEEWPKVGDKALNQNGESVTIIAVNNGVAWVELDDAPAGYSGISEPGKLIPIGLLTSPPTPREILLLDIVELIKSLKNHPPEVLAVQLVNRYNIKPE